MMASPSPLRETDLYRLWAEQRFPPGALRTVDGRPVRVLYRGRPGGGAGPDFRHARVSVGGAPSRLGDIELHVHAADFYRHGHLLDPAYARVVLHVVFDAGTTRETPLPGGGRAPVVALQPWVERRAAAIAAAATVGGPPEPFREPCHTAVARLGAARVGSILNEGGVRRLRAKAAALTESLAVTGPEQALYEALCAALGQRRNVEPFLELARRVPVATLRPLAAGQDQVTAGGRIEHALLAAAGLLPGASPVDPLPWVTAGVRPAAHPTHRIAGLAALLTRHAEQGLEPALRQAAKAGPGPLLRALAVPGVGRDRAVELAVNALLPLMIAAGDEPAALELAARLPAAGVYAPLTTLDGSLTADGKSLTRRSVLAQQGGLAQVQEWCTRGGCGFCPLS